MGEQVVGDDKDSKAQAKKKAAKEAAKKAAKKKALLSGEVEGIPLKKAAKEVAKLGVLSKERQGAEKELNKEEQQEEQVKQAMKMIASGKKGHFEIALPEFALGGKP